MKKYLISLILFAAIFQIPVTTSALIGLKEGDSPKEITLNDINGATVSVASYFGKKPVIIVFWELAMNKAFLNYSLDELRFMNAYYEKFHAKEGLEIFGIYTPVEETDIPPGEMSEVQELIKSNNITFPILIDRGFKFFREYGVIALPSTIMIGRSGKIEFIYPSFPLAALPVFHEKVLELTGVQEVRKKEEAKVRGKDSQSERLYHYALQMYKKGLTEQSLSPLRKSISLDPDYSQSHNLMGIIQWESGNTDASGEEFVRAIELDRNNALSHFNYGLLLFEKEKYSEAEKYLRSSIALRDSLAEAHYILGLLYSETDKAGEAVKELETALTLFAKRNMLPVVFDSTAHYRISALVALSDLYVRSGNEKMCLNLLQQATAIALGTEGKADKGTRQKKYLMVYE
ncbi:MAG: hypothetical protein C4538_04355 [Nitrospiraceae bacterium]|nr:MAG: hypothetical protein C4538_04355 [Nitrospiraceae bacterium]